MTAKLPSNDSSTKPLAVDRERTLQKQQVRLFCHLGQILCHLCARIPWHHVSPAQRRRLLPLIETLQAHLLSAHERLQQGSKPW